jgi:hypothetical protein
MGRETKGTEGTCLYFFLQRSVNHKPVNVHLSLCFHACLRHTHVSKEDAEAFKIAAEVR